MKWKTKDGQEIEISEMEDKHLLNTRNMLKRKGFITKETLLSYMTCGPSGDMASYLFEQEQAEVFNSPISPELSEIEKEINERRIRK